MSVTKKQYQRLANRDFQKSLCWLWQWVFILVSASAPAPLHPPYPGTKKSESRKFLHVNNVRDFSLFIEHEISDKK